MKNILLTITGACLLLLSCKKEQEVAAIKTEQQLGAPNSTSASFSRISTYSEYYGTPIGIVAAPGGVFYVSDTQSPKSISKIEADGTRRILPGKNLDIPIDLTATSTGVIYFVDRGKNRVYKIDKNDSIVGIDICMLDENGVRKPLADFRPSFLVAGEGENLYIVDENSRILKLAKTGIAEVYAGTTLGYQDGPKSDAKFGYITSIARKTDGTIMVGEYLEKTLGTPFYRIREISPSGEVSTFSGGIGGFADGARATAKFRTIFGLTFSEDESTLYLADHVNNRIRMIDASGIVSTIAGIAGYSDVKTGPALETDVRNPRDLTIAGNALYFTSGFQIYKLE